MSEVEVPKESPALLHVKLKCDWTGNPVIPNIGALRELLDTGGATGQWAKVPGLRTKYFTYCEATDTVTGVYLFLTKTALDAYKESDLFNAHLSFKHFSSVDAETHDVIMDGTRCLMDLGEWSTGAGKRPDRTDFDGEAYMLHVRHTRDHNGNSDSTGEEAMRDDAHSCPVPEPEEWVSAVPGPLRNLHGQRGTAAASIFFNEALNGYLVGL